MGFCEMAKVCNIVIVQVKSTPGKYISRGFIDSHYYLVAQELTNLAIASVIVMVKIQLTTKDYYGKRDKYPVFSFVVVKLDYI